MNSPRSTSAYRFSRAAPCEWFVILSLAVLTLACGPAQAAPQTAKPALQHGFLHAEGKEIKDAQGAPVLLRGVNLGGWMVQEGYLMQSRLDRGQHQIRAKIESAIGEEKTQAFYNAWLENYVQEEDVEFIAQSGFNAIRLPLHYEYFTLASDKEPSQGKDTWLKQGFELTDRLLQWCEKHQVYLILDLHAAPGGQGKGTSINDYDPNKPSLFESKENERKTVALWGKIAEHYSDEPWIGGYDLVNEPHWDLEGNRQLRKLYEDATAAIRATDKNHIIFIEGNKWASDFEGLTPRWDENLVYSFHFYNVYPDRRMLEDYLKLRDKTNTPLWVGEMGENSNRWLTEAVKNFEAHNIGWTLWPYKKIEGNSRGVRAVTKPEGYTRFLEYFSNTKQGNRPTALQVEQGLMALTEAFKFAHSRPQRDLIDALFRQPSSDDALPFRQHLIPGVLNAVDYDLGPEGVSYRDSGSVSYRWSQPYAGQVNEGGRYRNDGVDIEKSVDATRPGGFNVAWTDPGEWFQLTTNVKETAAYHVTFRVASKKHRGALRLELDGVPITGPIQFRTTGGDQTWEDVEISDVVLRKGKHRLRVIIEAGGFSLATLAFKKQRKANQVDFKALFASVSQDQRVVTTTFSKALVPSKTVPKGMQLRTFQGRQSVTKVRVHGNQLIFTLEKPLPRREKAYVTYKGEEYRAKDGSKLPEFRSVPVRPLVD